MKADTSLFQMIDMLSDRNYRQETKAPGNTILIMAIMMLFVTLSFAQNSSTIPKDDPAITRTVLDFYDGYYSGDAARMEKAIHQDISRATPRDLKQTGRTLLVYSTYSLLVESTRAKVGFLADTARQIHIVTLNTDDDVANIKVVSATFTDYLQLIKLDDQWKIVNMLSAPGTSLPPRMQNWNGESEKPAIEKEAMNYLAGISGADCGRIEIAVCPEYSKITIVPYAATGKSSLRRQRYESLMENTLAGIGKQDEIYRDNRVSILDMTDGIAVVKCDMTSAYEFVQMFKSNGEWKILNSISKNSNTMTFAQAITATVGKPMPGFTLPVYGGGKFSLSQYRGKNVLLVFPRGWIGTTWCPYCPYQYLELEQLENTQGIRAKNNLEIAFVMPYTSERIKDWMKKFPDALRMIENIKNPTPQPASGSMQSDYANWAGNSFPIKFDTKPDDLHNVIPVLVDENRTLSRQLKIFTNFWDGISAEQNMASVLIIDKNGILQFKYIGQMTEDRPSVNFLLDFIKKLGY